MTTLAASAEAIILLLGIGAVGFFMLSRNIVSPDILSYLSILALEVSLPLYVFATLLEQFDPVADPYWWTFPLWWVFFAAVTLALSLLLGRIFAADIRREATAALYLYNPLFVPLAVIAGLYGTSSVHVAELFLFTMFSVTFYFNFYPVLFRRRSGAASKKTFSPDWKKLFNPLIRTTLFTMIIVFLGLDAWIPAVAVSIARRVGDLAFTLVMLTLGGYIYLDMRKAGKIRWGQVVRFVAAKNLLFPAAFLCILYALKPADNIGLILILSAAAPPVSTIPILTGRQNGDVAASNQFLVGSFLFSILSIPLMITLFEWLKTLY